MSPPEYYHQWSKEWEAASEIKALIIKMAAHTASDNEIKQLGMLKQQRIERMLNRASVWVHEHPVRYRPVQ